MRGRGLGAQGTQTSRSKGGLRLVRVSLEDVDTLGVTASSSPFLGFSMPVMAGSLQELACVCVPTQFGAWDPQLLWTDRKSVV